MNKFATPALALALLLGASGVVFAQDSTSQTAPADNTRMNKGDQNSSQMTADQQNNNKSDLQLTKQIRQSIVKDKSLSTYAHNVKVIVQGGAVTLKGPVRSDEEKKAIVDKAKEIAGANNVTDQIEVASK